MSLPPHSAHDAVLLVDNGSLEPAVTLSLRAIATELGLALGRTVAPVSLLHSSAIPPDQIAGQAAEILESALKRRLLDGMNRFLLVPLFFGPSRALTDYLPQRIALLKEKFPRLEVKLAAPLVELNDPQDERVAALLEERVRAKMAQAGASHPTVILVDHGSPAREVTAVRDHVAKQLEARLGHTVRQVLAASMERRPGPDYVFSEPLLASVLERNELENGPVILALLFLSPGRHAGPQGDIARLVAAAQKHRPHLRCHLTELVGSHPGLIPILVDRARAGSIAPPL